MTRARIPALLFFFVGVSALAAPAGCSSSSSVDPDGEDGGTSADGGTLSEDGAVPGQPDGGAPDVACTKDADCPSGVCNIAKGLCEPATCTDGVKNGSETAIDCGGSCSPCADGKGCKVAADCTSSACKDAVCQAPSSTDGVKNGTETDVDCGGAGNPKCADAAKCKVREDCTSAFCKAGVCTQPAPADGEQNGDETDVDCGGSSGNLCADALKCLVDGDCASDVCADLGDGQGKRCQAPTPTDGKKNGTETDVDCGGGNPGCAAGLTCAVDGDCASGGCNYQFKCASHRSCKRHWGGDTCGFGGAGSLGAEQWEDCCATAEVTPTSGPTVGQTVKLGKYQVTAGRIRAFLEDVNYDVRGFVQQARALGRVPAIPGNAQGRLLLEPDWDLYLPTSFDGNQNAGELADCSQGQTTSGTTCMAGTEQAGIYTAVKRHLGGFIFKANAQGSTGCFVGAPGTHAFRFPEGEHDGAAPQLGQDDYDTKSMQCIDYLVGQAFCVWDGGRLELGQEWVAAWGAYNPPWAEETTRTPRAVGTNSYWGCRFPWATDAMQDACAVKWDANATTIEYADYQYSYEYPKLLGSDYIVFISAPGRTRGRGPFGHADLIGNNYGLTSNVTYAASPFDARHGWNASGSWEVHGYAKPASGQSRTSMLLNKYGKLGLRCAYP